MLKYLSSTIVFQEIPDEITLALEITNCPHQCKNCHSAYLRQDIGVELTDSEINKLIESYPDVTCICLMGGDSDHKDVIRVSDIIQNHNKKAAMYSGDDKIDVDLLERLDYYKVGSYIEEKGPLTNPNTNQRMYKRQANGSMIDITERFYKK